MLALACVAFLHLLLRASTIVSDRIVLLHMCASTRMANRKQSTKRHRFLSNYARCLAGFIFSCFFSAPQQQGKNGENTIIKNKRECEAGGGDCEAVWDLNWCQRSLFAELFLKIRALSSSGIGEQSLFSLLNSNCFIRIPTWRNRRTPSSKILKTHKLNNFIDVSQKLSMKRHNRQFISKHKTMVFHFGFPGHNSR